MIKTFGLTHIALPVKDVKRSSDFYQKIFGVKEMYSDANFVQVQTPGSRDIIVFEQREKGAAPTPTGFHFGFRLLEPSAVDAIVKIIEEAGGEVRESGEFVPGEPYVFFFDPDGYEVEIWFEKLPPSLNS